MSILFNGNSKVIIQGITGKKGLFFSNQMISQGVQVVAGVSPGKGGDWVLDGKIPVFDTVDAAIDVTGADVSILFVPEKSANDALIESINAEIPLIISVTNGMPNQDILRIKAHSGSKPVRILGPGSPGIITLENKCIGIIPPKISKTGNIGVVSRSGPMAYQIIVELIEAELGISTFVGLGDGEIIFSDFCDILELFEMDPNTEKILILGENNSDHEEKAAQYISDHITKPVIGYLPGKNFSKKCETSRIYSKLDARNRTIEEKKISLKSAGVRIAALPQDIPLVIKGI